MKISDALKGVQRLGVETAPYIYYVENHPIYADKMDAVFQIVEANYFWQPLISRCCLYNIIT